MKALALLFAAGLASARVHLPRQLGSNNLNLSLTDASSASSSNLGNLNLGDLSLGNLQVAGLNLGSVDLGSQEGIAEAILAMLGSLCLGNALDQSTILSFGYNNDVDLFFQLAQLMQLEQLGFLDLGGAQSLVNSGQVSGSFSVGVFKRKVSEAKKTMKRARLRRDQKVKRQCATGSVGSVNSGSSVNNGALNIATVATVAPGTFATVTATASEAGFAIATASAGEAGLSIATAVVAAGASSAEPVSFAATSNSIASPTQAAETSTLLNSAAFTAGAASEISSVVTTDAQVVASATPLAAAASATPATAVGSTASVPAAAAAATPTMADVAGGVDNLSDLTR